MLAIRVKNLGEHLPPLHWSQCPLTLGDEEELEEVHNMKPSSSSIPWPATVMATWPSRRPFPIHAKRMPLGEPMELHELAKLAKFGKNKQRWWGDETPAPYLYRNQATIG